MTKIITFYATKRGNYSNKKFSFTVGSFAKAVKLLVLFRQKGNIIHAIYFNVWENGETIESQCLDITAPACYKLQSWTNQEFIKELFAYYPYVTQKELEEVLNSLH